MTVSMQVSPSDIGNASHTPSVPKYSGSINIRGIKNKKGLDIAVTNDCTASFERLWSHADIESGLLLVIRLFLLAERPDSQGQEHSAQDRHHNRVLDDAHHMAEYGNAKGVTAVSGRR